MRPQNKRAMVLPVCPLTLNTTIIWQKAAGATLECTFWRLSHTIGTELLVIYTVPIEIQLRIWASDWGVCVTKGVYGWLMQRLLGHVVLLHLTPLLRRNRGLNWILNIVDSSAANCVQDLRVGSSLGCNNFSYLERWWMDGWMDGWVDGWMEGRTDGRTDGIDR